MATGPLFVRTTPFGTDVLFKSSTTGEHELDAYLESAEKGGRTLGELIDQAFDDSGNPVFATLAVTNAAIAAGASAAASAGTATTQAGIATTQAGIATTKAAESAASAVASAASASAATTHIARTDNPHATTKAQVGLGNVDNTSDATKDAAATTLTNKTLTNPVINGFTGSTAAINIGSGQIVKDTSGNVGLGTTPIGNLDVYKTSSATSYVRTANQTLKLTADDAGSRADIANSAGSPLTFTVGATERARIDGSGNLTLSSGALGYGAGAGGTVTQITSKATNVTLNKPSGRITTAADALAGGASVLFGLVNSLIAASDTISVAAVGTSSYFASVVYTSGGAAGIRLTNITGGSLSEAVQIQFNVHKGATA